METDILGNFDIYINDGNYGGIYPEKSLFLSEGVPFLSASDFSGKHFNFSGIKYVSKELHFNLLTKGHLKNGDIIIVVRGNGIGKVGYFDNYGFECNLNAQLAFIRTNPEELSSEFLYYLFASDSYQNLIKKFGSGSAQPQLPINRLKLIPVIKKDIITQRKIAAVLSALDDKIELNNQLNAQLEQMAKTIYDYWFAQFDFPNSPPLEGCPKDGVVAGKPYKSSGGKMVFNEVLKREIPVGWEVRKLSEIANVKAGGDKPRLISENKTQSCNVPIFSNGITNEGLYGFTDIAKVFQPSITISARGTIGYTVLRSEAFVPIIRLISVTPIQENRECFFFYEIRKLAFENSGSVQQQLTVPQVSNLEILNPEDKILEHFSSITQPIFQKIDSNKKQNQELAQLRDWLLPMLMNGQVSVGSGEYNREEGGLGMVAEGNIEFD